nr:hypothetical protein [Pseudomonas sp. ABC1]
MVDVYPAGGERRVAQKQRAVPASLQSVAQAVMVRAMVGMVPMLMPAGLMMLGMSHLLHLRQQWTGIDQQHGEQA